MGIPDSSLQDLIQKVRSWISWGKSAPTSLTSEFEMPDQNHKTCCECELNPTDLYRRYQCQSCGRVFCGNCAWGFQANIVLRYVKGPVDAGVNIRSCRLCSEINIGREGCGKYNEKICPSESPRQSPEPPSPSLSWERADGWSPCAETRTSITSCTGYPSPISLRCSPIRSDDEEAVDSLNTFFSPSSEYYYDTSDVDSSGIRATHDFYSFKSVKSTPCDSPSTNHVNSSRVGHSSQKQQVSIPGSQNYGYFGQDTVASSRRLGRGTESLENTDDCADDLSIFRDQYEKLQKPLDFENNDQIWLPPPPEVEDGEVENYFFSYDDDDDDDDIGDSGMVFSSSSSLAGMFPAKEKLNEGDKEPLKAIVQGHFRALVAQLLHGEGIGVGKENSAEIWLDIVTSIAWQAANFVRPDTSRGGSMDPGDYVKVKCIASGSPSERKLIN
ncbi:1-phosphatidylinositol-3-phosphate 5-kinase [Bertholletia excelsa]